VPPFETPKIVWSSEADKDSFQPKEKDEQGLRPEVPYLSAIGALMYLANCTLPDIALAISVGQVQHRTHQKTLGWRENHPQIFQRHSGPWVVFSKKGDLTMVGYVDVDYMSDPHNARSHTSFVFLCGGATVA
jgi:hypothetical protein